MPAEWDERLLGYWQSDRLRTFRHFRPKAGCRPVMLRRLKAIFGKMTVRWTRGRVTTKLDDFVTTARYRVIGRDADSVVVYFPEAEPDGRRYQQIWFHNSELYCLAAGRGGVLFEFFRRIPAAHLPTTT